MDVYRAIADCPVCKNKDEIWNYKGVFEPANLVQCTSCDNFYNGDEYLFSFLELRSDNTVSTKHISKHVKKLLDSSSKSL